MQSFVVLFFYFKGTSFFWFHDDWIFGLSFMQVLVGFYSQFLSSISASVFVCSTCLTEFQWEFRSDFRLSARSIVDIDFVKISEQSEIV